MADLRDIASKAADNVARLAALFHLFECGSEGAINKTLVEAASDVITWHLYEAKRFLNEIVIPAHVSNAIKLDAYILKYCREHNTDVLSQNYILQRGTIRDAGTLKKALQELAEANHIRLFTEGRASMVKVNPELLGGDYAK
jgi:putative DNA primase/helicase